MPVYLKAQITTLSLHFWKIFFEVFDNIAQICDICNKTKHKEMENNNVH